jgi:hypothetical protein
MEERYLGRIAFDLKNKQGMNLFDLLQYHFPSSSSDAHDEISASGGEKEINPMTAVAIRAMLWQYYYDNYSIAQQQQHHLQQQHQGHQQLQGVSMSHG